MKNHFMRIVHSLLPMFSIAILKSNIETPYPTSQGLCNNKSFDNRISYIRYIVSFGKFLNNMSILVHVNSLRPRDAYMRR